MIYLNNKQTGIQITVNPQQVFKYPIPIWISENGKSQIMDTFDFQISTEELIQTLESGSDYLRRLVYEKMQLTPKYSDFEISNNPKNWKFETELYRVNIPNQLFIDSLQKQDALGQMITQKLQSLVDFSVKTENWIAVYVTNMTQQEREILEMYPDVIIEERS